MWHSAVGCTVTLLLSLLAVPLVAHPQSPGKVSRIGVLNMGPAPSAAEWQQSAFLQELRQLGYVEGQTIVIEQRYADGEGVSELLMPCQIARPNS
jgi:putative tryptophan/tyrosine transport system substrate-binding protein